MGHQAIAYGRIETEWRRGGQRLVDRANAHAVAALPRDDSWPWLTRGMFGRPAPRVQGTYRCPIVHFGTSIKDDPFDASLWDDVWVGKFEALLRRMFWNTAVVHVESELWPTRTWHWRALSDPTDETKPITRWERTDPPPHRTRQP